MHGPDHVTARSLSATGPQSMGSGVSPPGSCAAETNTVIWPRSSMVRRRERGARGLEGVRSCTSRPPATSGEPELRLRVGMGSALRADPSPVIRSIGHVVPSGVLPAAAVGSIRTGKAGAPATRPVRFPPCPLQLPGPPPPKRAGRARPCGRTLPVPRGPEALWVQVSRLRPRCRIPLLRPSPPRARLRAR